MPLVEFYNGLWKQEHESYKKSILSPIAPEYTTGEVLLGAAYRKLLLGIAEQDVDLEKIPFLPSLLPEVDVWTKLLLDAEGLASPSLKGQSKTASLAQLMPLVPAISIYANVRGKKTGRRKWEPGNLLLTTLRSGTKSDVEYFDIINKLRVALNVGTEGNNRDDFLAIYVENELLKIAPQEIREVEVTNLKPESSPAWRIGRSEGLTPAERLVKDMHVILNLKKRLTRRQWTVLVEALLRIGLGTHVLWLCHLNWCLWKMVLNAVVDGIQPNAEKVEKSCWNGHGSKDPLLELGRDATSLIKKRIREYVQARIGINIVLHALQDAGCPWDKQIGIDPTCQNDPPSEIADFLSHVAKNATQIKDTLKANLDDTFPNDIATRIADANPHLLNAQSGISKNLYEFLRHTLGQLSVANNEMRSYDQAYILYQKNRTTWLVQPGPVTLIMLVHACCKSFCDIPVSIDDFRTFLAEYGIFAPAGELLGGQMGRDLERLGLVVDSPDAGGGRLLVDPF